jgi:hypothetical protein
MSEAAPEPIEHHTGQLFLFGAGNSPEQSNDEQEN